MNLKSFLELIEFKAKTASLFPFLLGCFISIYHFHQFDIKISLILYLAMFLFNCFVDIWDNYMDYINAKDTENYKVKTNIIGRENLNLKTIRTLLIVLFLTSSTMGLYLVFQTGYELLILGLASFLIGLLYSYGKRPISTTPFGELSAGLTMGFLIPLITIFTLNPDANIFSFENLFTIFMMSFINISFIANLLFANNICDMEEDRKNGRFTLAHLLGFEKSIKLFKTINILGFLSVILSVILGFYPVVMLGLLLVFPKVINNTKRLKDNPVKSKSFKLIVANLAMISILQTILFVISIIIKGNIF